MQAAQIKQAVSRSCYSDQQTKTEHKHNQPHSLKAWVVGEEQSLGHGRSGVATSAYQASHDTVGAARHKGHNSVASTLSALDEGREHDHNSNGTAQGVVHVAQNDGEGTHKQLQRQEGERR